MALNKNHYIQIAICTILTIISVVLFAWYYREYIAPQSYTIGTITEGAYKKLEIKDYISDKDVLFSQNINDVSFAVTNGRALYEYTFDSQSFNGLTKDYAILVNNDYLKCTESAGRITASYVINYFNVNNEIIATTTINIEFTFQSNSSNLRVYFTEQNDNLALLMNYFKKNDFIITLTESPFEMDQVQTDDEYGRIDCRVVVADDTSVYAEYDGSLSLISNSSILVDRSGSLTLFTVISADIDTITVDTDGDYELEYDASSYEYKLTWSDANFITVSINAKGDNL